MTRYCKMRSIYCCLLSPSIKSVGVCTCLPSMQLILGNVTKFPIGKSSKNYLSIHKHTGCPVRLTNNHFSGLDGCQPFIITGYFLIFRGANPRLIRFRRFSPDLIYNFAKDILKKEISNNYSPLVTFA